MFSHLNDHVCFFREFATFRIPSEIVLQGITAQFAWNRFLTDRWPITLEVVATPQELGRCYLPWYYGPNNSEVSGDDPGAKAFRLDQALGSRVAAAIPESRPNCFSSGGRAERGRSATGAGTTEMEI
jgi:hypothetical protein